MIRQKNSMLLFQILFTFFADLAVCFVFIHLNFIFGNAFVDAYISPYIFAVASFLFAILPSRLFFKNSWADMGIELKKVKTAGLPVIAAASILVILITVSAVSVHDARYGLTAIATVIYTLAATGFIEEVVFRGIIYSRLQVLFRNKLLPPVLLSALLFSLVHIPTRLADASFDLTSVGGILYAFGIPFLLGVYFALLYHYTGNLWQCMVIHALYDCIADFSVPSMYFVNYVVYIVLMLVYLVWVIRGNKRNLQGAAT